MSMGVKKEEQVVIPGQFLAYEEEFGPGFGAYVDNGEVFASNIGIVEKDIKRREVRIRVKTKIPIFYKRGMTVYGVIEQVSDTVAFVTLFSHRTKKFNYIPREASYVIPVTEVKRGFVKTMKEEFKVGDIVKVKIVNISPTNVTLSVKSADLGVVKAFCSNCRSPLYLEKGTLVCKSCGSVERRKISLEYSKVGGMFYGTKSVGGKKE